MAEVSKKVESHFVSNEHLGRFDDRLWRLDVEPRNIYVAATLPNQAAAMRLALQLQDAGFVVTSRWLRVDFAMRPKADAIDLAHSHWHEYKQFMERMGRVDLEDLEKSDTLVVLADVPSATGGYHVELGYFLGSKKTNVVVVGNRPNVFFWTERVRWTLGAEGLVEWLLDGSHGRTPTVVGDVVDFE